MRRFRASDAKLPFRVARASHVLSVISLGKSDSSAWTLVVESDAGDGEISISSEVKEPFREVHADRLCYVLSKSNCSKFGIKTCKWPCCPNEESMAKPCYFGLVMTGWFSPQFVLDPSSNLKKIERLPFEKG